MKNYGAMKKVEFTGRDVNEINKAAKAGYITLKKWYFMKLMSLVTYYGYDDNRSVEREEGFVMMIIEAVKAQNWDEAQRLINNNSESMWASFSRTEQEKLAAMNVNIKAV